MRAPHSRGHWLETPIHEAEIPVGCHALESEFDAVRILVQEDCP